MDAPIALCNFCGWSGRVPAEGMPLMTGLTELGTREVIGLPKGGSMTCPRCRHDAVWSDDDWDAIGWAMSRAKLAGIDTTALSALLAKPDVTELEILRAAPTLASLLQVLKAFNPDRVIALLSMIFAALALLQNDDTSEPPVVIEVERRTVDLNPEDLRAVLARLKAELEAEAQQRDPSSREPSARPRVAQSDDRDKRKKKPES